MSHIDCEHGVPSNLHCGACDDSAIWRNWVGGGCPQPRDTLVQYRMRGHPRNYTAFAGDLRWDHMGLGADIVEYRPIATTQPDHAATKPTNPKDAIGIKKAPMSTVSGAVMAEVGVAMLEGASKYGRHNYRGVGVRASVYYDATMRHLIGWWEGEDLDPDSGVSHITKAIASLVVLRDAMIQDKMEDDRPPRSKPFYPDLNARSEEILKAHADKNPKHWTIDD